MNKIGNVTEKTIETGDMFRSLEVREGTANEQARTVELSFSSDQPYRRWFGWEILDHSSGSVRLGRLQNAGPLLDTHYGDQIGVIENVSLDGSKGTAVVRFSKGARANEVFQDVMDGIRRNVSVGYSVYRMVLEEENETDGDRYRVVDWEPYEISMVPVPADQSVGVGRGATYQTRVVSQTNQTEIKTMADETKTEKTEPQVIERVREMTPAEKAEAIKQERAGIRDAEMKRMQEIEAIAAQFPQTRELCDAAKRDGKSVEDVRAEALGVLSKGPNAVMRAAEKDAKIGMTEKDMARYSMRDAILCQVPESNVDGGFYREMSQEAQKQLGRKDVRGVLVPDDVLCKRDLTVAGTGSNVVATNLLGGSFIDLLLNRMALTALGVDTMTGLVGDIAVPKATSGATMYWLSESEEVTESTPVLGQITATPKTGGATVDLSRKLLQQSSISVEAWVRNEIARRIAIGLDSAGINGTGANGQPSGLLIHSDIADVTCTVTGAVWSEILNFRKKVKADNAELGAMRWLTNATVEAVQMGVEKATNTGIFVMDDNGRMGGFPTVVSEQCPSQTLILGVWSQLVMCMWGGLDLTVNPYTQSKKGIVEVTAFRDVDFMVRHGQSFAYTDDITG